MRKNKGFTLIELLAVIVILAIILVIAVPQILKVIDQSRKDALASSVKLTASSIETAYLSSMVSGGTVVLTTDETACPADVVDFDASNGDCTYTLALNAQQVPVATVTIVGDGKFDGWTGTGTKASVSVTATTTTP